MKRKRLRKGTHSCWQCKKRKVKCIPDPLADGGACDGCRRRGSRCVGQDSPEDVPLLAAPTPIPDHTAVSITVTANTNSLPTSCRDGEGRGRTKQATASSCDQSSHQNGLAASASTTSSSPSLAYFKTHGVSVSRSFRRLISLERINTDFINCFHQRRVIENDVLEPTSKTSVSGGYIQQVSHGRSETLSQLLHRSLPSREDAERICTASQHQAVLAHEIMTMPYIILREKGLKTSETLLETPGPDQHPVFIARHMLLLSSFLQRKQISYIFFILLRNCVSQSMDYLAIFQGRFVRASAHKRGYRRAPLHSPFPIQPFFLVTCIIEYDH